MNKLKNKTSRFFREAVSADEQAALAGGEVGGWAVFDAGIGGEPAVKKKKSFLGFRGRVESQPPPMPPMPPMPEKLVTEMEQLAAEMERGPRVEGGGGEKEKEKETPKEGKGFFGLKGKKSRFFRQPTSSTPTNPQPPAPKLPEETHKETPKETPKDKATTMRVPPPRPMRPASIDSDLLAFMNTMGAHVTLGSKSPDALYSSARLSPKPISYLALRTSNSSSNTTAPQSTETAHSVPRSSNYSSVSEAQQSIKPIPYPALRAGNSSSNPTAQQSMKTAHSVLRSSNPTTPAKPSPLSSSMSASSPFSTPDTPLAGKGKGKARAAAQAKQKAKPTPKVRGRYGFLDSDSSDSDAPLPAKPVFRIPERPRTASMSASVSTSSTKTVTASSSRTPISYKSSASAAAAASNATPTPTARTTTPNKERDPETTPSPEDSPSRYPVNKPAFPFSRARGREVPLFSTLYHPGTYSRFVRGPDGEILILEGTYGFPPGHYERYDEDMKGRVEVVGPVEYGSVGEKGMLLKVNGVYEFVGNI